ncbi:tubulin-like doman-containing protein [Geodermatophilus sp. SYSU D00691]
MYKICVVGLGGSGGKTLRFLMEQLKAELAAKGWTADQLPRCWEFVHIDVPAQPDGLGPGLPPAVDTLGGTYIPVTSPTDDYGVLDAALQRSLVTQPAGNQLRQLARWRPQPNTVDAITHGASQLRAVGRLLTLTRAGMIYDRLVPVAERLNQSGADTDLSRLAGALARPGEQGAVENTTSQGTILLVVSSLAGGTGASMTLDVCNLLHAVASQVPHFPHESLAFLYTPDVFSELTESERGGVNANALGTVAELMSAMAARQQPWTAEEWTVYGGVPRPTAPGRGPMLTFPVGSYNGVSGARFGDGRTDTIYRGFARSLTALFLSEAQQGQLMSYAIGNLNNSKLFVQDHTHMSLQPARGGADVERNEPMVFGSLGFASIGLGRDRYAQYAAQRLARQGVERLLRGHVDLSVLQGQRSPQQAIATTAGEYYPQFLAWAGLPDLRARDTSYLKALVDDIWADEARTALSDTMTQETVGPVMRPGISEKGAWFAQQLGGLLASSFGRVMGVADAELREAAIRWVPAIQNRLETATLRVIGERGLPVAEHVLETFRTDLQFAAEQLTRNSATSQQPHEIAQEVTGELQTVGSTIDANHGVLANATNRIRAQFSNLFVRRGAATAGELFAQLNKDVIGPLRAGVAEARAALESAEKASAATAPVSTVATDQVVQWPRGEEVPTRFATAQNEVLLEDISSYPRSYADHLLQNFKGFGAGSTTPSADRAEELALFEVLTWLHADARTRVRPADRLTGFTPEGSPTRIGRRSEWWPQALASVQSSRRADYAVDLDHHGVLDGALAWVTRAGEVMGTFIQEGLDSYLTRPGAGVHEREATARHFVERFRQALQLAAPLVAVDARMVQAVHTQKVAVGYRFSELPFGPNDTVGSLLVQALQADSSIDPESVKNFTKAMVNAQRNRIDILGAYANLYHPMVFSSLQKPIRNQWLDSTTPQMRQAFWSNRRGRPLVDFVPVSRGWLQAVVSGWLVGRLTGEVLLPGEGPVTEGGVAVWSAEHHVLGRLPQPLLGVENSARDAPGWGLLAAVTESLPLAIALCDGDAEFTALRPYLSLFELGRYLQDPQGRGEIPALRAWFGSGLGRSGLPPRGKPGTETTAEARLAAARAWAASVQRDAAKQLPPDPATPGERGSFSEITPHNFWQVPRVWELAPQLYTAGQQLLDHFAQVDYTGRQRVEVVDDGFSAAL